MRALTKEGFSTHALSSICRANLRIHRVLRTARQTQSPAAPLRLDITRDKADDVERCLRYITEGLEDEPYAELGARTHMPPQVIKQVLFTLGVLFLGLKDQSRKRIDIVEVRCGLL